MDFRKTPSESELIGLFSSGEVQLPPFALTVDTTNVSEPDKQIDAFVTLAWGDRRFRFAAETTRLWTPKALLKRWPKPSAMPAHPTSTPSSWHPICRMPGSRNWKLPA